MLSRKVGESLVIGGNARLYINRINGNRVTIGIEAPDSVRIVRGELEGMQGDFASLPARPSPAAPTTETPACQTP